MHSDHAQYHTNGYRWRILAFPVVDVASSSCQEYSNRLQSEDYSNLRLLSFREDQKRS